MDRDFIRRIVRRKDESEGKSYFVLLKSTGILSNPKYVTLSLDTNREIEYDVDEDQLRQVSDFSNISLDSAFAAIMALMLSERNTITGITALSSRTDFLPYQIRPLLKYYESEGNRLLIADEVGLGKTVEACYILLEEMNQHPMKRVVILCPSHLRGKWQWELYSKFGVSFTYARINDIIDMLQDENGSGFLIASLDCANSVEKQQELQNAISNGGKLDFLLIDEVHHCIGRSSSTFRRELALALSSISSRVVVMSASPVQIEVLDLKRIHDILFQNSISDDEFLAMLDLVKPLNNIYSLLGRENWTKHFEDFVHCLAELEKRLVDSKCKIGDLLIELRKLTLNSTIEERFSVRTEVWRNNPTSSFMTRARKKEVGQYRHREVNDCGITLNDKEIGPVMRKGERILISERKLFKETKTLLKSSFSHVHVRQLSSSLPAVLPLIEQGIEGRNVWKQQKKGTSSCMEELESDNGIELSESEIESCKRIAYLFRQIDVDTKWIELTKILMALRSENQNRKVVVFTQWIPTLNYFREMSKKHELRKMKTYLLDAGNADDFQRQAIISKFRQSEGFAVLFSSDILSEGIDLYEADTIINYDLPYNPQRLEQRVGRVDRIKQKSKTIRVYNVFVKNSVDEEILLYLKNRIGYFKDSVGMMGTILESESDDWQDIDETKTIQLLKRIETIQEIEESGSLTVLDDILDSHVEQIRQSSTRNGSGLRWLPLVSALKILAPSNYDFERIDGDIIIRGVDTQLLEALTIALGSFDGEMIKQSIDYFLDNESLIITTNPDKNGWFPHLRNPLMKYAFDVCLRPIGLESGNMILIQCPRTIDYLLNLDKIRLIRFIFSDSRSTSISWSWWGFGNGKWAQIDIETERIYWILKNIELELEISILECPNQSPDEINMAFDAWKEESEAKYRSKKQIELNAEIRRLYGRKKYQERRLKKEDVDMQKLVQDDCQRIDTELEEVQKRIFELKSNRPLDYITSELHTIAEISLGLV